MDKAGFFVRKMNVSKALLRIKKIKIEASYKKENGNFVLSFDDVPTPEGFKRIDQSIVYIAPGKVGGNHKHKRTEVFVGIGEGLKIYWLDEKKKLKMERMNPSGELFAFLIPPFVPHAIKNFSKNGASLIELANSKQTLKDVERVIVIS